VKTVALGWSLWRTLPRAQRRQLYHLVRRHGASMLAQEVKRRQRKRGRR